MIIFFLLTTCPIKRGRIFTSLRSATYIRRSLITKNAKEIHNKRTRLLITHSKRMQLLLLMFLSLLTISIVIASNNSMIAQTQQGIYIGRQLMVNNVSINYWLGIPYAEQPVGNLRWRPPQALGVSNNTVYAYNATACPQSQILLTPRTESCLTLNVYAPKDARNLSVYVWIHGGAYIFGAGVQYNAFSFISTSFRNGVPLIVVTINYRLGLLGFLADEGLYNEGSGVNNTNTTGNYGILDQIMALNWIKRNIAGFGGNPNKITVGGQSAGGISVHILLTSPLVAAGTFQAAIVQSGGLWANSVWTLQQAINNTGNILRNTMSCTTLQCLRNLTTTQILAIQNIMASSSISGAAAIPVIDGYVLNDSPDNNYALGNFQRVPLLIGSNTNETSYFTCPYFNDTATVTQVQGLFQIMYNSTIVNKIPDLYGPISSYNDPLHYLNTVFSNSWAHCRSRRVASKFSSSGLSSYLYTYNYLSNSSSSCLGVTHTAELPMLFPAISSTSTNSSLTAAEQQLSTSMILYWASFIEQSNPNFNGRPANWDAYLTSSDNELVFNTIIQMRNGYYYAVCSNLWDPSGSGVNTNNSFAEKINPKCYFHLLFLILFIQLYGTI